MAVSRRVGGAVVRNRVKRYLREIYRRERTALADGIHLVLVARASAASLNFQQCGKEIQRMLRAEGLLRE